MYVENLPALAATVLCLIAAAFADVGLKFNATKLPFAEYRPWDLSTYGLMEVYFQTGDKNALLLYQDDGEGNDWIDVFLVDGKARLRLRMGACEQKNMILNGSFNDFKWHRLNVERNYSLTSFSVDGLKSNSLSCKKTPESPGKPKPSRSSLYLGGIPFVFKSHGLWSNPSILYEAQSHRFTGCIARVRYSNGDKKLRRAKYINSSQTTTGCVGACGGENKGACKNGGKCVDMLVRMRCDCRGTGYEGMFCDEQIHIEEINNTTILHATSVVSAPVQGKASAVHQFRGQIFLILIGLVSFLLSAVLNE